MYDGMSMGEEAIMEMAIAEIQLDHWFYEIRGPNGHTRQETLADGAWITKNGYIIPLQSLEDDHLINIINMCKRMLGQVPRPLLDEKAKRKGLKCS